MCRDYNVNFIFILLLNFFNGPWMRLEINMKKAPRVAKCGKVAYLFGSHMLGTTSSTTRILFNYSQGLRFSCEVRL